jgi:hypothetical protein
MILLEFVRIFQRPGFCCCAACIDFCRELFGYVCHEFARSDHGVLLFLPFSFKNIGGAERIHSDIVFSNISKSPWVVLANEWHDEPEQAERETAYRLSNISRLLRNPFTKNLLIGFFAGYINGQKVSFWQVIANFSMAYSSS